MKHKQLHWILILIEILNWNLDFNIKVGELIWKIYIM